MSRVKFVKRIPTVNTESIMIRFDNFFDIFSKLKEDINWIEAISGNYTISGNHVINKNKINSGNTINSENPTISENDSTKTSPVNSPRNLTGPVSRKTYKKW